MHPQLNGKQHLQYISSRQQQLQQQLRIRNLSAYKSVLPPSPQKSRVRAQDDDFQPTIRKKPPQRIIIKNIEELQKKNIQPQINPSKPQIPPKKQIILNKKEEYQSKQQPQSYDFSRRVSHYEISEFIPTISQQNFPRELLKLALPNHQTSTDGKQLFFKTVLKILGQPYSQPWLTLYKNGLIFGSGDIRLALFENRKVYVGRMNGTTKQGRGIEWESSKYFIGQWRNGKREGFGIENNMQTCVKYKGQWKNGVRHGQGVEINQNSMYEGSFMFGLKHGQGQEKYEDGSYYRGCYTNGQKHGFGQSFQEGVVYRGDFYKGNPVLIQNQTNSTFPKIVDSQRHQSTIRQNSSFQTRNRNFSSFQRPKQKPQEVYNPPIQEQVEEQPDKQPQKPILRIRPFQQPPRREIAPIQHPASKRVVAVPRKPIQVIQHPRIPFQQQEIILPSKNTFMAKARRPPTQLPFEPKQQSSIQQDTSRAMDDSDRQIIQNLKQRKIPKKSNRHQKIMDIYYPKKVYSNVFKGDLSFDEPILKK